MAQLIDSISSSVISGRTAKEVFEIMKETGVLAIGLGWGSRITAQGGLYTQGPF